MYDEFLERHPEFVTTARLDRLRASEFSRLDAEQHVYLDYTGGGLFAECQLRDHLAFIGTRVLGNPHSRNPTSCAMNALVDKARGDVLRFFKASEQEYTVIFTANSTGALKLLGESYPFGPGSLYALTADNHNSVNGIREFAKARGASVKYAPVVSPELRIQESALRRILASGDAAPHKLFAFPAQSNFTGVQHPLEWVREAREQGWDVLLDAASFAPTNRLDLSAVHPDFVDISFYKIFGYPTGVGCLLARKAALTKLVRPWYAGGTITFSTVATQNHYFTPGPATFEDGTVNYLAMPAVSLGIEFIESIGIDMIHTRVMALAGWVLEQLTALRHSNGVPVVRIYGPTTTERRGATIQMNFFDQHGKRIDSYIAERIASAARISLRAGCHCNPGAREAALGFSRNDLEPCFANASSITFDQFRRQIVGKTTGALRMSIGIVTNFADIEKYLAFARSFVDKSLNDLPAGHVPVGCSAVDADPW